MPLADSVGTEYKVVERPLNMNVVKLREKRDRDFKKHLRERRDKAALIARGGMDQMENEYLRAHHENELRRLEELSSWYEDNDYCHSVMDDEAMYEELMRIEEREIEELTKDLKI